MTAHDIGELVLHAWKNHHKRNSFETRDAVVAHIMGMDGIDWDEFAINGAMYRKHWDRVGWQYNSETLLAWVRNGCCPPPPEPETAERAKLRRLAGEE